MPGSTVRRWKPSRRKCLEKEDTVDNVDNGGVMHTFVDQLNAGVPVATVDAELLKRMWHG